MHTTKQDTVTAIVIAIAGYLQRIVKFYCTEYIFPHVRREVFANFHASFCMQKATNCYLCESEHTK